MGANRTTWHSGSRPTVEVGDKRLPPLGLPEHPDGTEWHSASVEFWRAITGHPARRSWEPTHHALAVMALVAYERSLSATGPGWSAECRRLVATLPGGVSETDRPVPVPAAPSPVASSRPRRPDPRLASG